MTTAVNARTIRVFNSDYQPIGKVSFKGAVKLLVKDKAVVHEADESRGYLREVGGRCREWAYPKAVRLVVFVKLNYKKLYGAPGFSKHGVLKRDKYKCAYCGKAAKTIDHIIPRCRGGMNDWLNTVAACFTCNNKKDDKTLKEANMKLMWQPFIPTKAQLRDI